MPTSSCCQTSFCTIRSILSNSAHMSGHVPTGVIASASALGLSGSARKPFRIACLRSSSRFFLSYIGNTVSMQPSSRKLGISITSGKRVCGSEFEKPAWVRCVQSPRVALEPPRPRVLPLPDTPLVEFARALVWKPGRGCREPSLFTWPRGAPLPPRMDDIAADEA